MQGWTLGKINARIVYIARDSFIQLWIILHTTIFNVVNRVITNARNTYNKETRVKNSITEHTYYRYKLLEQTSKNVS